MTPFKRGLLAFFCLCFSQIVAYSQVTYSGGSYAQNFDTLPNTGTFTFSGAGPFALDAAPVNASGLAGWSLAKYSGTGANALFNVGTGSSNTGSVYSFGAAGSTDRALGSLSSGSTISRFGVSLVNNTGTTITQFTLGYTGEQWRRGSASANKLTFSYGLGAANINTGTFVNTPALDFTAPNTTSSNLALDGNIAGNRTVISATVSGISWTAGQTLVLRWTDVDDAGSDDGVGIDDLTFTTNVGSGGSVPAVSSTLPADGSVNIPANSNVSVTFNMPVTVTSSWFSIVGSSSGAHSATVSGGPSSYTLVPDTTFTDGETVTTTIFASQVTDAATGVQHPAADFVFNFNILSSAPLPIHSVQGSGTSSPYVGQAVSIQGVVTASFQGTGGLGGFYLQAPESDYDSDPATSEGIFVFDNTHAVSPGDVVRLTGTVAEFGTAPHTDTEITSVTAFSKTGTATLPAPVALTLPFVSSTDGERYEGMRVTFTQKLTVTDNFDLGHFGEFILSNGRLSTPTNIVAPGAPAIAQEAANLLNQILVDDDSSVTYPDPTPFLADSAGLGLTRRTGSTVTGITGILDDKFGVYIVEPTAAPAFADDNPRGAPPVIAANLHIAIGNVLNFFNGDGAGGGFPTARGATTFDEYQRQRAKIVAGISRIAPDIMGLTEVENDGFGPTSAIADIVNGLNAAAAPGTTYAFVDASGVDNGTDLIHVAFIYRVETVETVGSPASLNNQYFEAIARPPLAQTFREKSSGEKLTVCINHFRAKGSAATGADATDGITPNPNNDTGDGQATNNYVRKREAQTLVQWLATDPTGSGDPDFLIIGDLNSYAKEDPITAIESAGYTNLTETYEGSGGYSYLFDAEFGHLDHALATAHLTNQVTGAYAWHLNSDEPVYYDYNTENKSTAQAAINVGTPYRYSDHDPVVIGVTLHPDGGPSIDSLSASPSTLLTPNHRMVPVTISASVNDPSDPSPTTKIISVESNEPITGTSNGDIGPDWQITGELTLNLRAERASAGTGRVYTITVECRDHANVAVTKTVTVNVPR